MTTHARTTHERRDRRRPLPPPLNLQERDHWIIEALAKMRFLTTSQIARLFFNGSRSITNRRLRRLFDAGLLRVWVRDLADDNVYALTSTGRVLLEDASDLIHEMPRCPQRLDGQLDHLLAINTVRIALATAHGAGTIVWWRSDWQLRATARAATVPDARFALSWPDIGERVYALEVEYHTRAPRKFLTKMLRYSRTRTAWRDDADETILVVGRHQRWLERYRTAVAPLALASSVWFTTLDEIQRRPADGAIWRAANRETRVAFPALANCPNGNSSAGPENHRAASAYAPQPAHISPSASPSPE